MTKDTYIIYSYIKGSDKARGRTMKAHNNFIPGNIHSTKLKSSNSGITNYPWSIMIPDKTERLQATYSN